MDQNVALEDAWALANRRGKNKRRMGIALALSSPVGSLMALFMAALTINPCGAFGDACEDYGKATLFGQFMLFVAAGCAVAFVCGLLMILLGSMEVSSSRRPNS